MAIVVETSKFSVVIKNVFTNRFVQITHQAWKCLADAKHSINRVLMNGDEFTWPLDEDVCAYTEYSGRDIFVHIRYIEGDIPVQDNVRGGLAILPTEWNFLMGHLPELSKETELGIRVYEDLIYLQVKGKVREVCYGCKNNNPDHNCVMSDAFEANIHVNNASLQMREIDFVLCLAQEAWKKNFVLENPHHTYQRVRNIFDGFVVKNVKARFS